jgi:hypothetical protein
MVRATDDDDRRHEADGVERRGRATRRCLFIQFRAAYIECRADARPRRPQRQPERRIWCVEGLGSAAAAESPGCEPFMVATASAVHSVVVVAAVGCHLRPSSAKFGESAWLDDVTIMP